MERARNIMFVYDDHLRREGVTVQGTPFYPAMGPERLLNDDLDDFARLDWSSGNRTATIKVDLGQTRAVSAVCFANTGLSPAASRRLRLSNDPALLGGTPDAAATVHDDWTVVGETQGLSQRTIGPGPVTMTVAANLGFLPNRGARLVAPDGSFMQGDVTAFDAARGLLALEVTQWIGSGTHGAWTVQLLSGDVNVFPPTRTPEGGLWGDYPWSGVDYRLKVPFVQLLPPLTGTARYALLQLGDATNPALWCDMKRLLVGPAWQPSSNIEPRYEWAPESLTQRRRRRGGGQSVRAGGRYRVLSLVMEYLPGAEAYGNTSLMSQLVGTERPFLTVISPQGDGVRLAHETLWGNLVRLPRVTRQGPGDHYRVELQIEEWPDESA
ncbi:MAG TPA: hypothetical protein VED40_10530 [Azospirillaceae bacterium]|nr:hypothetical protein [Azospirillaceae bacterium]